VTISLEDARSIVGRAEAAAEALGIAVNIAVLDGGGHLKAFARMDDAVLGSIDIALKKAKTSVLFAMNSETVGEFSKPGAPAQGLEATNDVLVTFAGGVPLKDENGHIVGAIGVSGGAVEQDRAVALAGVLGPTHDHATQPGGGT
jgi:uncharacterized protein GlcG (DUF336 family)